MRIFFQFFLEKRASSFDKMKDLTLPPSKVESKPPDHGYAKSASISTKKAKKHEVVVDPKQRRLPFAKVPASQTSVTTYVSSDSDEPLASITAAEGNSVSSMKKSAHSVNGVEHKHSPLKQLDKCSKDKVEVVPSKSLEDKAKERKVSSPKFTKSPSLIPSPDISKKSSQAQNPLSIKAGEKKEKAKLKKLSNGNKVKKSTQSKKKEPNRSNKKMKKVVVALSTDSDSDLDVPLSQLKASPKQKKKPKIKNVKSVNSTAMSERSPKVKISHAKSPKSKDKVFIRFLLNNFQFFTILLVLLCLAILELCHGKCMIHPFDSYYHANWGFLELLK